MTGFGTGQAPLGDGRLLLEIRSLNHRFLEARVRLPSEIAEQTFYVEQQCRERLHRGRYDVTARIEGPALPPLSFDIERGRAAYQALVKLRDEVAPDSEVPLSLLASLPELVCRDQSLSPESVRTAIDQALGLAVEHMNEMRRTEGHTLRQDLLGRLNSAREIRRTIASSHPELAAAYRKRVEERLERLLSDHAISTEPARLNAEIALLAERGDLSEELARLESHFDQFESLCAEIEPVGRRLDFLLQEIGREANTIGAKCQDAALGHLVVSLKADIERMREQVQNVE